MANTDIIVVEEDLVEQDGILYKKLADGTLQQTAWDSIMTGFETTEKYRLENICALRRDKYFKTIGIDINMIMNNFISQSDKTQLFNESIVQELIDKEVDFVNIFTNTTTFESISNIYTK